MGIFSSMTIETHKPTGLLSEFVDSIIYLAGDSLGTGVAFPRMHQVIIINMGSNFTVSDLYETKSEVQELSSLVWINGSHDNHFMLGNVGSTAMYAITIKLGMLGFLMDLPASETHDDTVDAINWSSRDIFFLREQLFACSSIREGLLLIEQYLFNLIKKRDFSHFERIKWMNKAIYTKSVNEICHSLGITRKRLRAESHLYFGSSVKNIQGLIRFNQTLATIARNCNKSLSSLHDFYDQSHFINDFKARTGITPIQYKRLCQEFPHIKYTPNFLALKRDTYLDKVVGKSSSDK